MFFIHEKTGQIIGHREIPENDKRHYKFLCFCPMTNKKYPLNHCSDTIMTSTRTTPTFDKKEHEMNPILHDDSTSSKLMSTQHSVVSNHQKSCHKCGKLNNLSSTNKNEINSQKALMKAKALHHEYNQLTKDIQESVEPSSFSLDKYTRSMLIMTANGLFSIVAVFFCIYYASHTITHDEITRLSLSLLGMFAVAIAEFYFIFREL